MTCCLWRTVMARKNCSRSFEALLVDGAPYTTGDSAMQSTASMGIARFGFGGDFAEFCWERERECGADFSAVEPPVVRADDPFR